MDPLTHTLVGVNLAATGLRQKTPMAAAALVIGANLPDVDVLSYFSGGDLALGFRRGWTHGLPAVAVLPWILTAVLILWDRLRRRRHPDRPPPRPGPLLGLAALGVATHPTLDWLNTYGMRWLMPFSDRWFYGDAVFIMDPWLWLLLGGAWLLGRRPTLPLVVGWGMFAAGLAWVALASGAGSYLPLLSVVAAGLLAALLCQGTTRQEAAGRLAQAGLALATAFIVGMLVLQSVTETRVRSELEDLAVAPVQRLMVGPKPANPLQWDVLAEFPDHYRYGTFDWLPPGPGLRLADGSLPNSRPSLLWQQLGARPEIQGFLSWVRFPWHEVERTAQGHRVFVMDARYARQRTLGFGGTSFELDELSAAGPPGEPPGSRTSP